MLDTNTTPNLNGYLSTAEFSRSMEAIERQMNAGFTRVETRLHRIEEGTTRDAERLAVLEVAKKSAAKKQVSWTAAMVGVITVIAEVARRVFVGA